MRALSFCWMLGQAQGTHLQLTSDMGEILPEALKEKRMPLTWDFGKQRCEGQPCAAKGGTGTPDQISSLAFRVNRLPIIIKLLPIIIKLVRGVLELPDNTKVALYKCGVKTITLGVEGALSLTAKSSFTGC